MTTALLVMVHGSPHPSANDDMFQVIEDLRTRPDATRLYPIIEAGFMECNAPSILEAIDRCVAAGAQRLVAVPYFLHIGTHVCDDLPTLLEAAQAHHPNIEILLSEYIGLAPLLTDLLAARAVEAVPV